MSRVRDGGADGYRRRYIRRADHLQHGHVPNKDLGAHRSNEAYCVDCGNRITVGRSVTGRIVEYGHRQGNKLRCPHRPATVDTKREASR